MVALLSVLLALLPLQAASGMEIYRYATSVPQSSAYSVRVDGAEVPVLAYGQLHLAQFGSDSPVDVVVGISGCDVRSVDVRPLGKGYDYELDGNVLRLRLAPYDRVTVEVNGDTGNPLMIFVNPLEAERSQEARGKRNTLYFKAGNVYPVKRLALEDYDGLYIEGGAIVKAVILASDLSNFKIEGCGILDCTGEKGNAAKLTSCGKLSLSDICVVNGSLAGFQFANCTDLSLSNVKVINLPAESADNNKAAFAWSGCKKVRAEHLFAYSQSFAYQINNKFFETAYPTSDIELSDCIGWNALTASTLSISGAENLPLSDVRVKDFYAIHSAGRKPAYRRSAVNISQSGSKQVSGLRFSNVFCEDPNENALTLTGWISDVVFDGVTVLKQAPRGSELKGTDFDHRVENVVFRNFRVEGQQVHSLQQAGFKSPSLGLNIVFTTRDAGPR